jgi:hypothetical protein
VMHMDGWDSRQRRSIRINSLFIKNLLNTQDSNSSIKMIQRATAAY